MKIAFDAKRALNNVTGLGNYSRLLLNALMQNFKLEEYALFTPKIKADLLHQLQGDFTLHLPNSDGENKSKKQFNFKINSLWRSWQITAELQREHIQIYHGLSNELPFNIHTSGIKTVVTIHDLIFLKHTEQYPFLDRQIYKLKTKYAANKADKVIAISQQTKLDLINYYGTSEKKIDVVCPTVSPLFKETINTEMLLAAAKKYSLPKKYVLHVGSFFSRKNQSTLIEAFDIIKDKIEEDLILVGSDGNNVKAIKELIEKKKLNNRVKVISTVSNSDMPAIYQSASLFVYPSIYEGFGMPIVEALWSKVPVITTKGGCFEEAGGSFSHYINPLNTEQLADSIVTISTNDALKKEMINQGYLHAQTMTDLIHANKLMAIYRELI